MVLQVWRVIIGISTGIDIENDTAPAEGLTIYAAQLRNRVLGPVGRWLLDELRSSKN